MENRVKAKRNPKLKKINDAEKAFLDAAEIIIGENGYHGTSMRAVAEKANANLGSINYYFGSKEVLVMKVLERSLKEANEERLKKLKTCKPAVNAETPDFTCLLKAYIEPMFAIHKTNPTFDKMVLRIINDPAPEVQKLFRKLFDEPTDLFIKLSRKCNPRLSMEESYWRLNCVVGSVGQLLVSRSYLAQVSGDKFVYQDEDLGLELVIKSLYRLYMAPPDMPGGA